MDGPSLSELLLNSEKDAKSFIKWFLRTSIHDLPDEHESEEARNKFLRRREAHFNLQMDELSKISLDSGIPCKQESQTWFKIVKDVHLKNPLDSIGSLEKASRFNYKNSEIFQNRVVYFGQDKDVCFGELFHLDIQKRDYNKLANIPTEFQDAQFKPPKCSVIEYTINMDNILVLTSEPAYKALGIADRVVKNEWYSLNDEFEIPTAGQIMAVVAKKRGFSGILYASVRSQTKRNLVLFDENTGPLYKNPNIKEVSRTSIDPSQFL